MEFFTDSKTFANIVYKKLPDAIKEQRYVNEETIMKILRGIGVLFFVLPVKDVGTMADYIQKHSFGLIPKIVCKILSNFFVLIYPIAIVMLLVTFLPISCVFVIVRNTVSPRSWYNQIRDTDIIISRFLFGALFISLTIRGTYESFEWVHTTAIAIELYPVLYFVGYFTCIYPFVLLYHVFISLMSEPVAFVVGIFLQIFEYPLSLLTLLVLSPLKSVSDFVWYYISKFLSAIGFVMIGCWKVFIFIPTSLIYALYTHPYIMLFLVIICIWFRILGRDHRVGILLPFKNGFFGWFGKIKESNEEKEKSNEVTEIVGNVYIGDVSENKETDLLESCNTSKNERVTETKRIISKTELRDTCIKCQKSSSKSFDDVSNPSTKSLYEDSKSLPLIVDKNYDHSVCRSIDESCHGSSNGDELSGKEDEIKDVRDLPDGNSLNNNDSTKLLANVKDDDDDDDDDDTFKKCKGLSLDTQKNITHELTNGDEPQVIQNESPKPMSDDAECNAHGDVPLC